MAQPPAPPPQAPAPSPKPVPKPKDSIRFFGSQVGGESVISYGYTDMPLRLLMWDFRNFFYYVWALPWIIWPMNPCDSGDFDELALTPANIWCVVVHTLLIFLQLGFICYLPLAFLLPVWLALSGVAAFFLLNWAICLLLNGKTLTFHSDPKYASPEDHPHEQWIFLNGVAVGETWMKSNINRLALTFKRPIIGIHNQTSGIIFDVVECLIQRNFGYATGDVRMAYKVVKEKLYSPQYSKVVFILHSQGGIEGGLVLDWLLQELPQDLLGKIEVYTFGNAANHFNNPHLHIRSQERQRTLAGANSSGAVAAHDITDIPLTHSPVEARTPIRSQTSDLSMISTQRDNGIPPRRHRQASGGGDHVDGEQPGSVGPRPGIPASDRVIAHIEHYAHTTDFVALWGVLNFTTNAMASPSLPRFIGRVFSRTSHRGGHQFCQHYLDGMFPLARGDDGEFAGCADSNEFMDSVVEAVAPGKSSTGDPMDDLREDIANSFALLQNERRLGGGAPGQVELLGGSFHESEGRPAGLDKGEVRVRDLSRLWLYRNGRSPADATPANGVVRGITL